jgi:hypothetical protein
MTLEAQTIARACGKNHLHNLEPEDSLCSLRKLPLARIPGRQPPVPGKLVLKQ